MLAGCTVKVAGCAECAANSATCTKCKVPNYLSGNTCVDSCGAGTGVDVGADPPSCESAQLFLDLSCIALC